ncbi:cellulase family glycosylhydrolase [uncultured Mucilaginibacter sp.]|uniref:cellulase family glycosylhydrolase n=1 Tax=uncultured Mucilaginibacter sp. TaxID=797541 RepID=UPI0026224702|nr:cellulase family glycosylhydrolase [uncultured Mucilaginibacter sp.]
MKSVNPFFSGKKAIIYTFTLFSLLLMCCFKKQAEVTAQPTTTTTTTALVTLAGNGVNLQPSYYNGGNVDLGFPLMKQQTNIKTIRIEIEPTQVTNAIRWIKEASGNGYTIICTYHKATVLGSDNLSDLLDGANWWKTNYAALSASGKFYINLINEWGSHNLSATNYASYYNQAITIVRTVYNGTIIVDIPGYGQETYVATNAVLGIGTGGIKITDANIALSAHIYPGNYVGQHTNSSGSFSSGGNMVSADLDYLATSGRTCLVGEFGNGTNGTTDWSGLVDYAKSKSWTILGWSWAGDGGDGIHPAMNMIAPNFQPYTAGTNYPYTLSSYFNIVYNKL